MIVGVTIGILVVALLAVATWMLMVGLLGIAGARYVRCASCGHLVLASPDRPPPCPYCRHPRVLHPLHPVHLPGTHHGLSAR